MKEEFVATWSGSLLCTKRAGLNRRIVPSTSPGLSPAVLKYRPAGRSGTGVVLPPALCVADPALYPSGHRQGARPQRIPRLFT